MFAAGNRKSIWLGVLGFAALASCSVVAAQEKAAKRPFTVQDDIAFVHFPSSDDPYCIAWLGSEGIQFSPHGEFFAVLTARGSLETDQVEESLRFYRTKDVQNYLRRSGQSDEPAPQWVVKRSSKKEAIVSYQWLADSSGVALREATGDLNDRVVLLDLRKKSTEALPFKPVQYEEFEIRDREHYVYTAFDEAARKEVEQKLKAEQEAPMKALTGDVWEVLEPEALWRVRRQLSPNRKIWAAVGGEPFEVKHEGVPLDPDDFDLTSTHALSPDGQTLLTRMRVKSIPPEWEKLYLPPYPSAPYNNIHAGGSESVLVRRDLKTGATQRVVDAPPSGEAGWSAEDNQAAWSSDGQAIVLSATFLSSKDGKPTQPCVAVVDLGSHTNSCVEKLKARGGPNQELPQDYHHIVRAEFIDGDKGRVQITFWDRNEAAGNIEYRRTSRGDWEVVSERKGIAPTERNGLEISVKQAFDQPPMLVASEQGKSKVIWDPNPQFHDIAIVEPKIYRWKDKEGKDWEGGLYLPRGYQAGKRYPLMIQTHGFNQTAFLPAGSYPTGFAALELAGAGIAVLQAGGGSLCGSSGREAACEAAGFEAGARQLASDGIIDLEKVGYIGFSRSCWYGMEMLTNGSLRLKAAFLDDGIMADYFQSVLFKTDFKDELGVTPFGDGLEEWIKRSPGFHLNKITAPVLLGTERKDGALEMWQPYVGLRALNKPVEMEIVNTDEHVITNPVERLANQGLSVDWFRFWLQGYEDPDPAKADQYKRWRELRKMQEENNKKK